MTDKDRFVYLITGTTGEWTNSFVNRLMMDFKTRVFCSSKFTSFNITFQQLKSRSWKVMLCESMTCHVPCTLGNVITHITPHLQTFMNFFGVFVHFISTFHFFTTYRTNVSGGAFGLSNNSCCFDFCTRSETIEM